MESRIYENIMADQYHADPCPEPSLSSGIARLMVRESAMHAHAAHPRLGGLNKPANRAMDDGSILHKLLLGKGADVVPVDAADWRTNAAKQARDDARAANLLPVLAGRFAELERIAERARAQMQAHPDCQDFFAHGISEAVAVWREGDAWCRIMVDRLPDDPRASPFDIKTTEMSAAPGRWERSLQTEYAMQAAFYERGLRALGRTPGRMKFIVIEMAKPFAISVMACAPSLAQLAEADTDRAISLWRDCLARDHWPGYPAHTAWVDAPAWMLRDAEERVLREEIIREMAA